jgi:hypothetical protein
MDQVQVLFFELREDLVEVIRVVKTKFFIEEVIINSYEVFSEEHLELGLPILLVHILSLELLELKGISLFVLVDASRTTSWKGTS